MNKPRNATINCRKLLAQFNDKREALVLIYLLAMADDDGRVNDSIYGMARQLKMHRQTLTRIITRLCEKGHATWNDTATEQPKQILYVTKGVTEDGAKDVTYGVTKDVTHPTERKSHITDYESGKCKNKEILLGTTGVTLDVTQDVTNKEETKEKKEENPPAPPIEEKKQKKEEKTPSLMRACEEKQKQKLTLKTETLEQRRQQFLDSLIPYANCYDEKMLKNFSEYWTETNRSLTRMRFEMQPTWNTNLRLARWARNEQSFNNTNSHDKYKRFTSADYIREAQLKAIKDTEEFIRQAEIRRGGVPPHLPY